MFKMARIISFSIPENWEFTDEVMKMSSSKMREALEEGLKILKDRENEKTNIIGGVK